MQLMRTPTGTTPASVITMLDGTTVVPDMHGYVSVAAKYVNDLTAAGFAPAFDGVQLPAHAYTMNEATESATATAASVAGAQFVVINMTGVLGAGAALTLPTGAEFVAAIPEATAGQQYTLRVMHTGAGAFAWTVTAPDASVTLDGTATVAQATWRDYLVTLTSLTAVTLQNVGSGIAD